jgi:hypothetical protein
MYNKQLFLISGGFEEETIRKLECSGHPLCQGGDA